MATCIAPAVCRRRAHREPVHGCPGDEGGQIPVHQHRQEPAHGVLQGTSLSQRAIKRARGRAGGKHCGQRTRRAHSGFPIRNSDIAARLCVSAPQTNGVLKPLCESVVVPNITLREAGAFELQACSACRVPPHARLLPVALASSPAIERVCASADVITFEENPADFVQQDIEGGDNDTRRRVASDLVRAMGRHFAEEVRVLHGLPSSARELIVRRIHCNSLGTPCGLALCR